ncbi:mannose-6-phosphate isomerase, class I [Cellulomonas fimi]|uniref:mannose-6-phosphate isomerase, class I n=1 Tax=Cellulomonas fimi TaxID=1708 RepID=UPI00234D7C71|nr:mannose-6-phosphate isomerase, class I [Cellulomonas fimi]MDC7122978.1 mannose-6-phosphate isomerase, class I [Cellulomonas fimi]
MLRITHATQDYAWGSRTALHRLFGDETPEVLAEAWMGAHAAAPSRPVDGEGTLGDLIADDVAHTLGEDVVARFGPSLPYLLKVIAADSPLSLQVHPHIDRAREGFAEEEAAGIPVDAPHRNYRDRNHKPELVYALTHFEAMCGFRAPRRAAELFAGLDAPLAKELHGVLAAEPTADGIRAAFTQLLEPATRPSAAEVGEVAAACGARLAAGSPSPRADRTVGVLQEAYPGDPGVVTSLLLNPVTLQPGDAMFVPAGGVHAYLSGVGVEVMASSDNVLRAGLTPKHVDVPELLRNVDYVAAPPIRIAPEVFHGATKVFYAPVDDFELSVTEIADDEAHPLPGRGPRILLCLEGAVQVDTLRDGALTLAQGEVAFVPAGDGSLTVRGRGRLVQADVP